MAEAPPEPAPMEVDMRRRDVVQNVVSKRFALQLFAPRGAALRPPEEDEEAEAEPAPMEEDTPPEEEEEEECMYAGRFANAHGYNANGSRTSKSFMLAVLRKMPGASHKKIHAGLPGGTNAKKGDALMKLLETDKDLERAILDHRRDAIKQWNKERRAEDKAAAGVVDDGPLPYPSTGRSIKVLKGVMRERDDLFAMARQRFGDDLEGGTSLAEVLANKLMASKVPEDKDLVEKLYVHRNARAEAYRETLSGEGGREGRDGRTLSSTVAPTRRAAAASWIDEAGKKGTKALAAELELLEYTPPRGDDDKWNAIAEKVSSAAGRTYTGVQCYAHASKKELLRLKLPALHAYAPNANGWRPRKPSLEGLHANVKRGAAARRALQRLPPRELYKLVRMVYNHGIKKISGDKDALIAALVESNMPAVNPRKHGADGFVSASSRRFRRVFVVDMMRRRNVQSSLEASQRLLGPPSEECGRGGAAVATSVSATRWRLDRKNLLALCTEAFSLASDEAPPTSAMPLLHRYFCEPAFEPRVGYDPVQHCTCCRRFYIDVGGKVCCEHDWISRDELVSIRNNGACGVCNRSWIAKFDALRRDHRFDLGQLRRFAVMAWAKWG